MIIKKIKSQSQNRKVTPTWWWQSNKTALATLVFLFCASNFESKCSNDNNMLEVCAWLSLMCKGAQCWFAETREVKNTTLSPATDCTEPNYESDSFSPETTDTKLQSMVFCLYLQKCIGISARMYVTLSYLTMLSSLWTEVWQGVRSLTQIRTRYQ